MSTNIVIKNLLDYPIISERFQFFTINLVRKCFVRIHLFNITYLLLDEVLNVTFYQVLCIIYTL